MTASEQPVRPGGETICGRVHFFRAARGMVGRGEAAMSFRAPADAASAFEEILSQYPDLRRFGRSLLFAVNQEYAREPMDVREGDELAIFPPVSGGAGGGDAEKDFFELTTGPIDVGTVARRVVPPEC